MFTLIVVDYNALDKTIAYLRDAYACLGTTGAGHAVIIENGSVEGTLGKMIQQFGSYQMTSVENVAQTVYRFEKDGQEILYCNSGENLGYARGNNLGALLAGSVWNDPYYIISNNDLAFEESVDVEKIRALFEADAHIGAIGPRVTTPAGIYQSPRRWQSPFRRLVVNYWVLALGTILPRSVHQLMWKSVCDDTEENAGSGRCDWLMGCFFFLRRDAFEKAGMFDEHTFLYAEEMILSRRLERAGFYSYYCGEFGVIHHHGQTTRNAISEMRVKELDFESNCYFYRTYEHTSPFMFQLAKWNFALYKGMFQAWQKVKKILRR